VPSGRRGLTYRPHLDGLRCVAVYLVLAYHSGPGFFRRGFIGVDVFFVLSGYLVTRILLGDLLTQNRIDFRRFYSRRVRRILPAASVVLLVSALAYAVVATRLQMFNALDGFRAAFLYVGNWFFIHQSVDYFATDVNRSPVLQFWSLSVEEQFYLLWPLALTVLFFATARVGRMRWWALRLLIGTAALASVVEAIRIGASNPDRAYYGTDTRAYQLLAGALLALTPQLFRLPAVWRRIAPWLAIVALAGLGVASTSFFSVSTVNRGILAVVLTATLIVALENSRGGFAKGLLSLPPITYLGVVSYGTYLWHWPIVVVVTHNHHLSRPVLFVITCTAATGLAALSYHALEHPIRSARSLNRFRVPVVAVGLTVSVIGALVLTPAILETGNGLEANVGTGSSAHRIDLRPALTRAELPDCLGKPMSGCTLVNGTGLRVVLMGDSHARMWVPTLTAIAKQEGWKFSVVGLNECPWQRDLRYGQSTPKIRDNCEKHQEDWYRREIPELKPDVLVLAHQAFDEARFKPLMVLPSGDVGRMGQVRIQRKVFALTATSIQQLEASARKIVIMEPIGLAPVDFDPLDCLSSGKPASQCTYKMQANATPIELFYRSLSDHERVFSLDADRLVCPQKPICDPIVRGLIVKRDGSHLTIKYAASLAPFITKDLRRLGVLAPNPSTTINPNPSTTTGPVATTTASATRP
jgi:peptidoglycan/LPS O-acetylase OafA/YrhL